VGKSLAAGIATLDTFLQKSAIGYGAQNYFQFGMGPNWTSHDDIWAGRAQTAWLALEMFNAHCPGDIVAVEVGRTPQVDLPEVKTRILSRDLQRRGQSRDFTLPARAEVPTVLCYGFRDGDNLSVLVLSRELERTRSVRLRLPFEPQSEGVLLRLEAPAGSGPEVSNRGKERVTIRRGEFTLPGRTVDLSLAPCSALVLRARVKGAQASD